MMSESKSEKTPIYKKKWFWIVAILAIMVVGSAISSAEKDPKKVGDNGGTTSETENQTFKIGDTIAIDEQEVVVTSVDRNYTTGNDFIKPSDGKEYVKLNLQIKNTSKNQKDYNALYWSMEDSNGDIKNYAVMAQADDGLNSGQLVAGGTKKASLVFEVPKGDAKLKVHFKPSLISSREAVIELY